MDDGPASVSLVLLRVAVLQKLLVQLECLWGELHFIVLVFALYVVNRVEQLWALAGVIRVVERRLMVLA